MIICDNILLGISTGQEEKAKVFFQQRQPKYLQVSHNLRLINTTYIIPFRSVSCVLFTLILIGVAVKIYYICKRRRQIQSQITEYNSATVVPSSV